MIDPEIIRTLIEAGSLPDPEGPEAAALLDKIRDQDQINRLHWSAWDQVTLNLSTGDLIALIKALTIAECRFSWSGGSVSAVIWTFRELERRQSEGAEQLADWILARTSNIYHPFGFYNYGASSIAELRLWEQLDAKERENRRRRIELELEKAKERKAARKQSAEIRASNQQTSVQERDVILEKLSQVSGTERLARIARDGEHPLDYYPSEYAQISDEEFAWIDSETRALLKARLKDRRKGSWKKLYHRLMQLEGEMDNPETAC